MALSRLTTLLLRRRSTTTNRPPPPPRPYFSPVPRKQRCRPVSVNILISPLCSNSPLPPCDNREWKPLLCHWHSLQSFGLSLPLLLRHFKCFFEVLGQDLRTRSIPIISCGGHFCLSAGLPNSFSLNFGTLYIIALPRFFGNPSREAPPPIKSHLINSDGTENAF